MIKELGYNHIIWKLNKYQGNFQDILVWTDKFQGEFAITMSKSIAKTDLPNKLDELGIFTYVHTINNLEEKNHYLNSKNITEIYTDFLLPGI